MPVNIDLAVLGAFVLLWAVIVPTPGANSLMVTHVALTRSAADVAMAIAGNMVGNVLLAGAALLGMAALLATFPWLRLAMHVLGGAYLIYFGVRLLLRSRNAPEGEPLPDTAPAPGVPLWRTFSLGFGTALSNAQAIVFLTSIFAATRVLDASLATGIACIAAIVAMNASYLSLLGWLFQRAAVRRGYARMRSGAEAVVGGLFVAFGLRLIWRELAAR
ncbi:MAG TPA: LysE family transporter [Hyphomicrobiaceae bacterium]|nr:LysE family transporter [Hyphomicrobiaceae bacterium]